MLSIGRCSRVALSGSKGGRRSKSPDNHAFHITIVCRIGTQHFSDVFRDTRFFCNAHYHIVCKITVFPQLTVIELKTIVSFEAKRYSKATLAQNLLAKVNDIFGFFDGCQAGIPIYPLAFPFGEIERLAADFLPEIGLPTWEIVVADES